MGERRSVEQRTDLIDGERGVVRHGEKRCEPARKNPDDERD
jgi:hypothetical protein